MSSLICACVKLYTLNNGMSVRRLREGKPCWPPARRQKPSYIKWHPPISYFQLLLFNSPRCGFLCRDCGDSIWGVGALKRNGTCRVTQAVIPFQIKSRLRNSKKLERRDIRGRGTSLIKSVGLWSNGPIKAALEMRDLWWLKYFALSVVPYFSPASYISVVLSPGEFWLNACSWPPLSPCLGGKYYRALSLDDGVNAP